ncbi:unnamed protein product [Rotaria sp. Silwood1]|nr:unnamed protein product [Rotaria sp. Silwood1]CAF1629287.1 unnamed protein product [Rotaria sp. Silwood1]CAF3812198.1 unnamed protein product [Rotaria sp. Silwood1]CAF3881110.1 unnamed protein product [Rotaria sp. Silwood1]CAF3976944.1 unnamed protein product [Rotaria sp. Silwood1]
MSPSVIHTVMDLFVKCESLEKVRQILLTIVELARKEDGCLKYKLFENLSDNCQFTFIGAWENEDAFDDHLQSEHFRKADIDIKNDLIKSIDIKRYKYIQTDPTNITQKKTSAFCILT